MRKFTFAVATALGLLVAGAANAGMSLTSPDVPSKGTVPDEQVFSGFGCTGKNISPALMWKGAPKGTKSFALTVYDPDAPTGSGFWHWLVVNIPASTNSLPKDAGDAKANLLPAGALQTRTDFGAPGYGGPCPPKGDKPHHYWFTIFATDVDKFDGVTADASGAFVGFNLHFHTLAKAKFVATYGH